MGVIASQRVVVRGGRSAVVRSAAPGDGERMIALEHDQIATDPHRIREADEDVRGVERFEELIAERSAASSGHGLVLLAFPDDPDTAQSGQAVGRLMLWQEKWRKCAHQAGFGIVVHSAWRGSGLGTAMIAAMLDWAAAEPGLEKVKLSVLASNLGARRLYRRLGFRTEGRLRRHFKMPDGRLIDDILMAIWVKPNAAPRGFFEWRGIR